MAVINARDSPNDLKKTVTNIVTSRYFLPAVLLFMFVVMVNLSSGKTDIVDIQGETTVKEPVVVEPDVGPAPTVSTPVAPPVTIPVAAPVAVPVAAESPVADPVTEPAEPPEPEPAEPAEPEPTDPADPEPAEPADPEPTDPEPSDPEPTDPEPADPEPADPEPTDPEPADPEPADPEPADPEPADPEPADPEPADPATPTETLSFTEMSGRFQTAKAAFIGKLKEGYGEENYKNMFTTEDDELVQVFASSGEDDIDYERFKRRMQIKLLQTQTNPSSRVKYVWATGGHSSASGHGEFFQDSYTRVLGKAMTPVFESVGIDFVDRPYAMGGTASGMEIAFCHDQIFGQDVDALSWDFGMTDGNKHFKLEAYAYRAMVSPSHAAVLAFHTGGHATDDRHKTLQRTSEIGIASLYADEELLKGVMDAIPDTEGMQETDISALPEFVRNFKCGGQIETGEPYCSDQKWTDIKGCPEKFRVKWHWGFKFHALSGNLLALYVLSVLETALKELVESPPSDVTARLVELQAQEEADYKKFLSSERSDTFAKLFEAAPEVEVDVLMKEPSLCHTGRLPAEIRHKGILTETDKVGFLSGFDLGLEQKEADQQPNPDGPMRLVWDDHFAIELCEARGDFFHADFKDFFYVHQRDGWQHLTLPNNAEVDEYEDTVKNLKGYVAICPATCDWGKCPKGSVQEAGLLDGNATMEINGTPVSGFADAPEMNDCKLVSHGNDYKWTANGDGRFEIRVKVLIEDVYIRFSSFILW